MKESGRDPKELRAGESRADAYIFAGSVFGAWQSRVGVDSWEATEWSGTEAANQGRVRAEAGGSWSVTSWMLGAGGSMRRREHSSLVVLTRVCLLETLLRSLIILTLK